MSRWYWKWIEKAQLFYCVIEHTHLYLTLYLILVYTKGESSSFCIWLTSLNMTMSTTSIFMKIIWFVFLCICTTLFMDMCTLTICPVVVVNIKIVTFYPVLALAPVGPHSTAGYFSLHTFWKFHLGIVDSLSWDYS